MDNINNQPWFYSPDLPRQKGEVRLDAEEQRHMKAQRLEPEDKVSIFNGKGPVGIGIVDKEGHVQIQEVQEVPKSEFSLILAVAVPKGERADWMLQKLTELGVSTIIPLKTERSVVLPREAKQERWQRILIEACKQSRQAWLPELRPLSTIEQAIASKADLKLILDIEGRLIREALQPPQKTILAFIGPEGGFTNEEKTMLQKAGCIPVSLGKNILRIETAAMAMATAHNIMSAS